MTINWQRTYSAVIVAWVFIASRTIHFLAEDGLTFMGIVGALLWVGVCEVYWWRFIHRRNDE